MSANQKGFSSVVFAFALVTLLSCFSPVSSYFNLPRVSRTSDAIIIDCKIFIFLFLYNLMVIIIWWLFSLFLIQMKVWDILLSPWAEAIANMLIQDSFHFQHWILTACFSVDGLILVGKYHHQWSAKGSKAVALLLQLLGRCRSWWDNFVFN